MFRYSQWLKCLKKIFKHLLNEQDKNGHQQQNNRRIWKKYNFFFFKVEEKEYWSYYNDFQSLILAYKNQNLKKYKTVNLLLSIRDKISIEWQEELLNEVLNRLTGYCSDKNLIKWD